MDALPDVRLAYQIKSGERDSTCDSVSVDALHVDDGRRVM